MVLLGQGGIPVPVIPTISEASTSTLSVSQTSQRASIRLTSTSTLAVSQISGTRTSQVQTPETEVLEVPVSDIQVPLAPPLIRISEINDKLRRWRIKAQVTRKGIWEPTSTEIGRSEIFTFYTFKEQRPSMAEYVQKHEYYMITGSCKTVAEANSRYNSTTHEYCIFTYGDFSMEKYKGQETSNELPRNVFPNPPRNPVLTDRGNQYLNNNSRALNNDIPQFFYVRSQILSMEHEILYKRCGARTSCRTSVKIVRGGEYQCLECKQTSKTYRNGLRVVMNINSPYGQHTIVVFNEKGEEIINMKANDVDKMVQKYGNDTNAKKRAVREIMNSLRSNTYRFRLHNKKGSDKWGVVATEKL
uniref:Rep_fac-A_C domain-containing protein n=1 Tax=Strongyloides papillosus TaxID=174720 RepID=A0A0N5BLG3_STREA